VTVQPLVCIVVSAALSIHPSAVARQQAGSIRGVVYDADFNVPLAGAEVIVVETGAKAQTGEQGEYVLPQVAPGTYTLVIQKGGFIRQVRTEVVVQAGQLTDVDVRLAGEFEDMEEYVVEDLLKLDAGAEVALLDLRLESPALLDSIGADLMSRAGASDAASALKLVSGATVQDGKYAVIRGLPDRYVSSQMNGVRLPTADADKRAVELDQFPSAVIESLRVSKTFTPDQQGDASGGAVDVRLKGIPDEAILQVSAQASYNSQATNRSDFLTYDGGGVNFWGRDDGDRDIQFDNLGGAWDGAVGVSRGDAPIDSKWNAAIGGSRELNDDVRIGGFASFFYERDSSFYDDGVNDQWWVTNPGGPMSPQLNQNQGPDDFRTALFDVTQGSQQVQWGGLGLVGLETENNALTLAYLYTRTAEDTATLAEDTRSKSYFYPGYDPNDPNTNGHQDPLAAPYLRLETLEYTERTTGTLQLSGKHTVPVSMGSLGALKFESPEINWTASNSTADLYRPDKRQFGAFWRPEVEIFPGFSIPANWSPYKPAANFTIGNLQRIWLEIDEESKQVSADVKFPFEQWSGDKGYFKFGVFDDSVDRTFDQDTFSNFGVSSSFDGDFDQFWSAAFPASAGNVITGTDTDVDYKGKQDISALYAMTDMPLNDEVTLIGGARFESTKVGIVNEPEAGALWFPPGATAPVTLPQGASDVTFEQEDLLPAIALNYEPIERLIFRAAYSQTVARQTFKELTPIVQQEYLGGPVFIGNPFLGMSSLDNYDLRVDYTPYEGAFLSASWFYKDITDPIEYVQQVIGYTYTTAQNYSDGTLQGVELEVRQDLGHFWDAAEGFSVGLNGTFIDSQVTLPANEVAQFAALQVPITTRDMTSAPESLFNAYLLYDLPSTGTQVGLFYTVQGDTLIAGATQSLGNFVPSVYAKQFDSLNLSVSQKLGKYLRLQIQAKNLTNPDIEQVYRSKYISRDVTASSFTRGIEFAVTLGAQFSL